MSDKTTLENNISNYYEFVSAKKEYFNNLEILYELLTQNNNNSKIDDLSFRIGLLHTKKDFLVQNKDLKQNKEYELEFLTVNNMFKNLKNDYTRNEIHLNDKIWALTHAIKQLSNHSVINIKDKEKSRYLLCENEDNSDNNPLICDLLEQNNDLVRYINMKKDLIKSFMYSRVSNDMQSNAFDFDFDFIELPLSNKTYDRINQYCKNEITTLNLIKKSYKRLSDDMKNLNVSISGGKLKDKTIKYIVFFIILLVICAIGIAFYVLISGDDNKDLKIAPMILGAIAVLIGGFSFGIHKYMT